MAHVEIFSNMFPNMFVVNCHLNSVNQSQKNVIRSKRKAGAKK